MQDIIEGDDIPLCRLFAITLRALFTLVFITLTPLANRPEALE